MVKDDSRLNENHEKPALTEYLPKIRIGQGIDVHRLSGGRKLKLGGVEIPYDRGLIGHSDADALLHAITDAVIGALGEGDIGAWFSDTDPTWKDADSSYFLKTVVARAHELGWKIVNVDSTIVAEAPKMAPHINSIREKISGLLEIDVDRCNVKATTFERMGSLGRGEGIMAQSVVLLSQGS